MATSAKKTTDVSLEAMSRLAKIMNDTPSVAKLGKTEFQITALKPGTQWLIAEESCNIAKAETANFADVIKQFSVNIPSVVRVITLAILNDKDRIFKDYKNREYSDEFRSVYETIMWETNPDNWLSLLIEIMNMLSMDYFFQSTNAIAMIREAALGRKKKTEEQG